MIKNKERKWDEIVLGGVHMFIFTNMYLSLYKGECESPIWLSKAFTES